MTTFDPKESDYLILKYKADRLAKFHMAMSLSLTESIFIKRTGRGLTQMELAKLLGTKQSVISRLESGKLNPTVKFLERVAKVLECKLKVTLF